MLEFRARFKVFAGHIEKPSSYCSPCVLVLGGLVDSDNSSCQTNLQSVPHKNDPIFQDMKTMCNTYQIVGCILVRNRHHRILKYITFDYIYKQNLLHIIDLLLINISIFSNILLWCLLNSYSYIANQVIDGQDWRYIC